MANTINSTNNLTSTKIPELYIRYFNPKQKVNETISIKYYVSDSTQAEYLNKDDSKTFTTIVKIKDKTYNKTTKAGEYSIDIGSIANTGETYFSIYTIDDNGVASIEQFFDILIVNDSYNQVNNYNMTTADLSTYNITVGETASISQAKANNTGLNNLFKAVKNNGHNKITMLNKVYMLDYHSDKVVLPDHFTLDMNGATFKATQCNDINVSNLVDLRDCFDSHVKNGKLIGNYDGFDFEATKTNTNYNIPGEGLAVAEINGAKYSSFENMEMGYSVGYNLGVFGGKRAGYVGTPGKLAFPNAYYINDQGNTVSSTTMSTTESIDISTLLDRGEIQCNVYLGYGGLALNKAELFFHFYDSQSAYKTTIKSRQYQVVKIPSGTKYLRITGFTSTTTSSGMTICHTGGATNCELINIKSYNTRTCAMHPGIYNHLLIKNCSFNYVADENEYKVTKLALDFEDGYENGKNLFFINNEVYNGTSALTIQRAFNSNVINCRNFGLDIRGHIKGGLFKNNFFNDGSIYTTSFESQSHIKLHNNTFLKVLKFLKWDDKGDYSTIGLTKLDCKQSYQNNSNINVIIDKAVESSNGGGTTPTTLTISNISNITQTANTEFYIQYSTNKAVTKHEVSWDGGSVFYDKTSDVTSSGTSYKFKHDNSGNAGTYRMAIRVTTSSGETVTSNVFTVTLTDNTSTIYTITNNLTYCTTSNRAQHIDANTKYSATITANSGYTLSTITVIMGGSDVTSSVVNNNTITINSVTGNVVITAKATEQSTPSQTIGNMTNGKGVNQSTYIINDNADCWATINPVTVEQGATYTLQMDATWVWCYAYDDNDKFVKELFTSTGNNDYKYTFTAPTTKIRYGCYDPNKYLTYCNLTKTSSGSSDTYYTIRYYLHDSISSNTSTSIKKGSSYSTTITPKNGYRVNSISCMMGGNDVSNSVVSGTAVNIPNVTGDVSILADTEAIGDTNTYYTVHYHLSDSSSTNLTTSVKEGSSYSTTITPNNGYRIKTIYCVMGGTDISSSTVSGNNINIPNVTGEIYITVITEAISTPETGTIGNMTYGKGINQSTHVITDNAECWATVKAVTVEKGATYTLQMDGTWVWGYAFDDSDNYVSELFTSNGNNNYTYTFTAPTTKIRYGCYDPGKYLTYCNLTKTSGGTETLTISNISNITQTAQTEFYIEYSTNIAVAKHEVSWDGGNTFYDKTSDVTATGTSYKFKHDNKASAGTYRMAIRVTTSSGVTKTSNVFTVTLTSTSTPTPVYELADTVFDGSSKYVDTGVKPFKTASDYTIFIDFDDYGASQGQLPYLFHCAYENADGDGLKVYYNNEDNHYYIIGNRQNTSDGTYESSWTLVGGKNNKIAIAISKGVVSQIVINGSAVAVTKNAYDMNDYSLILGAYQDVECNKSKYWKGTIHTFKVWNSAFTVAQLKELCNSSSGGGSNPGGGDSGSSDAYRPGRTLIWEDDFTGTTLNTANWDYENNYSRPNEVQNYVAGTNNVWVENSNLVIKAKRESSNGKEWSSGCIHTDNKREFMYGRFEAKIKIPQTIGSFPAFWTLGGNYEEGNGITWPYCGEIDIMEHKQGYAWTTAGALYRTDLVWDNWDAKDLGRVDSGNIGSFDDYHIYAMEWTHDKLDYYVDDRLIGHSDISDDNTWFMFHQPHYILLNQALGAAGGSVPSNMTEYTMYVDWVRVYAPEEAPSGGGTSNQIWFEDTSARHMDKWSKLGLILKFNESWTNKVVTWKSSNTDIATVCGGRVDSKGVDGSCIITATTLEGNSASITVNVGSGGSSSDSTEYATSCTSAYILDKMYPMPQNHEALPSGVNDTWATQSRWENQQRPTAIAHNCGQANCPGAVAFRALGAWANVYRVKNSGFSSNTGVEMRNIKVYGWYNGQWEKVQDLAVPNGNFYAESFSGDSNTYFSDSIKTTSTSKTIILREANKVNGENCMYHPFSNIKNFDTKYQYVYTCIDLRKVKWNESGTDDRDSSHYCASCGGDWWLAEGLTFDSSWQHNKGIAQPKIIEITKEWRRFSMTTVPQNWTNGFPQ
jgi:beta-glucanase (GH16 family)|nr:MAG TPA_asm: laminarinase-like protein [Caudoviricetes sp.]